MDDAPPASTDMRQLQRWGSALAVIATAAVTLVCLAEDFTKASYWFPAGCLLLSVAPPLVFGALSLRPDQSIEAAWAQLLATLGVAGFLAYSYLDVAFQAFGPHRRSSTESLVYILAPVAAFPLGSLAFAVTWAVGTLMRHGGGRAERKRVPDGQAAELEQAQAAAGGGGEAGRPRRRVRDGVVVLLLSLGAAYACVAPYLQEQAAKDPATSPDVLVRLAKEEKLQYWVAGNPSTPPSTLARLAALPDPLRTTSIALARNPSTPPDVLCELAELTPRPETFDWETRMSVERNPSTPHVVAQALSRLHPSGGPAEQNWEGWPKENRPDCAQFKKPGP